MVCSDVMSKVQNQIPITFVTNSFPPLIIGAAFSIYCISTAFPAYKWNSFYSSIDLSAYSNKAQTALCTMKCSV